MSNQAPSKPYRLVSFVALVLGIAAFGIGLFNAKMQLNEKGYYLTVLLYGLSCSQPYRCKKVFATRQKIFQPHRFMSFSLGYPLAVQLGC